MCPGARKVSTKSSDVGGQPASQGPIWCETPHPFTPGTIGAEKFENVNEPVDDASAPDAVALAEILPRGPLREPH